MLRFVQALIEKALPCGQRKLMKMKLISTFFSGVSLNKDVSLGPLLGPSLCGVIVCALILRWHVCRVQATLLMSTRAPPLPNAGLDFAQVDKTVLDS